MGKEIDLHKEIDCTSMEHGILQSFVSFFRILNAANFNSETFVRVAHFIFAL